MTVPAPPPLCESPLESLFVVVVRVTMTVAGLDSAFWAFLMAADEMGVPARLQANWSGAMKRLLSRRLSQLALTQVTTSVRKLPFDSRQIPTYQIDHRSADAKVEGYGILE